MIRASARLPTVGVRRMHSRGTFFKVNIGTYAMQVPEADGKMRFWRNTSVANLNPGETATLSDFTVGYEWDEDADNGFRPAGSDPAVDDRCERMRIFCSTTARPMTPGSGNTQSDALSRRQRRVGLWRGHGAMVLGPGRQS